MKPGDSGIGIPDLARRFSSGVIALAWLALSSTSLNIAASDAAGKLEAAPTHRASCLPPTLESAHHLLPGSWVGEVRFYEKKLDASIGRLPLKLAFDDQFGLSGTVGSGQIVTANAPKWGELLEYRATIDGPAHAADRFAERRHVLVLISCIGDQSIEGDVHLKTDDGFDMRMIPGDLILRKSGVK